MPNVSGVKIDQIELISAANGIFRCRAYKATQISPGALLGAAADGDWSMVAMKSLPKSNKYNRDDSKCREEFRREYELLRSFFDVGTNEAYPFIVSAYCFEDSNNLEYAPYFLMELAERNLLDVLQDTKIQTGQEPGCYSFDHCLAFTGQIADALAYLHRGVKFRGENRSIIHRDLKSCNILIFNEGRLCKLCDFGISKPLENDMTGCVGTPDWTAPEVKNPIVENNRQFYRYSLAADCFSLGAVISETLFRKTPSNIGGKANEISLADFYNRGDDFRVTFRCGDDERFFYLNDSVFFSDLSPALKEKWKKLKNLLCGLFMNEPCDRLNAEKALRILQELKEPNELPALYSPLLAAQFGEQERTRQQSPPNIPSIRTRHGAISTHSSKHTTTQAQSVSLFFKVEKLGTSKAFEPGDIQRIQDVTRVMIENLNMQVCRQRPCKANFNVAITKDSDGHLSLEVKIQQTNLDEKPVFLWCHNNQQQCEKFFSDLFASDAIGCLKFTLLIPDKYMHTTTVGDSTICEGWDPAIRAAVCRTACASLWLLKFGFRPW